MFANLVSILLGEAQDDLSALLGGVGRVEHLKRDKNRAWNRSRLSRGDAEGTTVAFGHMSISRGTIC